MPLFFDERTKKDLGNDDFWQIKPPERPKNESVDRKKSVAAVGLSSVTDSLDSTQQNTERGMRIPPRNTEDSVRRTALQNQLEPVLSYQPKDSLLTKVTVSKWLNSKMFYKNFVNNARISNHTAGVAAPFVPYFSFVPQYCQLTVDQKKYYFYFRDMARKGVYLKSCLSYVLLYVYEIINLPDEIPPVIGVQLLWDVWAGYRFTIHELDRYMSEWMMDYCLLHQVELPKNHPELIGVAFRNASVPEFYLGAGVTGDLLPLAEALLSAASDYRYRGSRWYEKYHAHYDIMMPEAAAVALETLRRENQDIFAEASMRPMKVTKDAFCGSLCEQNIKRRITIEFVTMARSESLRKTMTGIAKYTENLVRAYFHLPSVLKVTCLPAAAKNAIDELFRTKYPITAKKAEEETPAYEAFYDVPLEPLSYEKAKAIETDSWEVTNQLVSYEEESEMTVETPKATTEKPDLKEVLEIILNHQDFAAYCTAKGLFPDEYAGTLNEMAYDRIGDVILEQTEGRWLLIEDYKEDVASWINT